MNGHINSEQFGNNHDLNRLWINCYNNIDIFDNWVKLVDESVKYDDIEHIRVCHNALLTEFPLCYGYWQKWSEHEKRHNNENESIAVLERGVKATPHSIDLWAFYASREANSNRLDANEKARSVYDRALAINGLDWRSGSALWIKYIDWESLLGNWSKVSSLYQRVIALPTSELGSFYSKYKELVSNHPLHNLLMPHEKQIYDDFKTAELNATLEREMLAKEIEEPTMEADSKEAEQSEISNEEKPPRVRRTDRASIFSRLAPLESNVPMDVTKAVDIAKLTAEAERKKVATEKAAAFEAKIEKDTRLYLQQSIDHVYQGSYDEFQLRYTFEYPMQRHFFHAQPLDATELTNWHKYLDNEEKICDDLLSNGEPPKNNSPLPSAPELYTKWLFGVMKTSKNPNQLLEINEPYNIDTPTQLPAAIVYVIKLYERCLVVCVNYPEIWLRYSAFLERQNLHSLAHELWARGISHLCKRIPETYIHYAQYTEANNLINITRKLYQKVILPNGVSPNLIYAIVDYINFERRQGDSEAIKSILERVLSTASGTAISYLTLFAARLYADIYSKPDEARNVFISTLKAHPSNRDVWLSYITWESKQHISFNLIKQENIVHSLCEHALEPFQIASVKSSANDKPLDISKLPTSTLSKNDAQTIYDWYVDWIQSRCSSVLIVRHIQKKFSSLCYSSFVTSSTFNAKATKLMVMQNTKKRNVSEFESSNDAPPQPVKQSRFSSAVTTPAEQQPSSIPPFAPTMGYPPMFSMPMGMPMSMPPMGYPPVGMPPMGIPPMTMGSWPPPQQ